MGFRSRKKAGVIGLGIIGSRVAENLRRAKFQTCVWNRTPKPVPNFLATPGAVAETCEILQIFVADPAALTSVLEMLRPKLKPHHLVLNHATVSPEATAAAAEIVSATGATFLDAPFTGSKDAATNAQIVYYIGGDAGALERARPVLEASGRKVIHIGKTGDATLIKIAMNVMIAMQTQALVEALALTTANGLDPSRFAEVLSDNAARSGVSEMKLPKILIGDYETHFSIKHMLKDVQFGMKVAEDCGLNLPATQVAGGALMQALTEGHGDLDFSAIAKNFPFLIAQESEPETTPVGDSVRSTESVPDPQSEVNLEAGPVYGPEMQDEPQVTSQPSLEATEPAGPDESAPQIKPKVEPPPGALIFSLPQHASEIESASAPVTNAPSKVSSLPVIERTYPPEPSVEDFELPLIQEKSAGDENAAGEEPPGVEDAPVTGPIRISDLADEEEKLVIAPPKPTLTKKVSIWGRPGLFRARNED